MRLIILCFSVAFLLSACGDPLRNVPRLSDAPALNGATSVAQTPAEARNAGGGLFGRLLNRQPDDPTNAAVEAALADAGAAPETVAEPTQVAQPQAAQPEPARGGLFGLFRGNRSQPEPVVQAPPAEAGSLETTPVAVTPEPVATERPRTGLAGIFRRNIDTPDAPRNGPDQTDVGAGAVMPFGEIARVCGLSRSELGTQVDGGGGFKIYDTIPNSTAPRPFYITGFDDNCARTFTGAVVVTGDIETHEFVRYQSSNERIAYSETDNAYEALKASVCRVGRGKPCGARSAQFNSNTHFITVYNFFGGTFSAVPTEWAQILVHDGRVIAMSIKDG